MLATDGAEIDYAFPTCVGMNRRVTSQQNYCECVPHVRGDEPIVQAAALGELGRSPRAWG